MPGLSRASPYAAFAHIDDFGILRVVFEAADLAELRAVRDRLKAQLHDLGLGVHKEVDGAEVAALGLQLGRASLGDPPGCFANGEKL